MAISRESFFRGDFAKKSPVGRENHPVMKFLRKNHRNAFTAKEISKAVGMKQSTIRCFLSIAKKNVLVHHDSPYFIVKLNVGKKVIKKASKKKGSKKKSRR